MENIESGIYEENLKNDDALPQGEASGWSTPEFNADEYREYVDGFDISEEQKDELLKTLWSIAVAFVDLGFGVDSVQRIFPFLAENSSPEESAAVKETIPSCEFNSAASESPAKDEESLKDKKGNGE